jgi:enoyl reductase-like protein
MRSGAVALERRSVHVVVVTGSGHGAAKLGRGAWSDKVAAPPYPASGLAAGSGGLG